MHFNIITSLALITGLVAATPTLLEKREDRPVWTVKAFTDDLCNKETGSWSDDQEVCQNLDNFSVDILSLNAEVEGTILNDRCSWAVMGYRETDCKGTKPEDRRLATGICRNYGGSERVHIKSYSVYKTGPCP
ncbi:hypothetical protein FSPOR_11053 [Fusarium sporotrichioides]|uniref:Uncharacterized protein n=1 Tax=Fusarium sporotrichioides TaxID=5514 RepID=A0A395RIU9_FUSSP|nr:hypothetical protein FSPOR_11053 [Fusarium sporotrichioides]